MAKNQAEQNIEISSDYQAFIDDLQTDIEGELAVDIYQDEKSFYIISAIAGVTASDVKISVTEEEITIRGKRQFPADIAPKDVLHQECFWGGFSRSIVLPQPITPNRTTARFVAGVLTITLPKKKSNQSIPIAIS